jgi:hypothetical protein
VPLPGKRATFQHANASRQALPDGRFLVPDILGRPLSSPGEFLQIGRLKIEHFDALEI